MNPVKGLGAEESVHRGPITYSQLKQVYGKLYMQSVILQIVATRHDVL